MDRSRTGSRKEGSRQEAITFPDSGRGATRGRNLCFLLIVLASSACAGSSLDKLRIAAPAGASREIAWTNKQAGVYYTETNGPHRTGWQGWRIMQAKVLDDYDIVAGGRTIDRSKSNAEVYPDRLVRRYPGGMTETLTLLDSVNALVVGIDHPAGGSVTLRPRLPGGGGKSHLKEGVLLIAPASSGSLWIALSSPGANGSEDPSGGLAAASPTHLTFLLSAGKSEEDAAQIARMPEHDIRARRLQRAGRMSALLDRTSVTTNDPRFDKALAWAKLSMDALIMSQRGKGIFAGLPWFDDYWGRDSFISLAGATLVTGEFDEAREILRSFGAWQDTVPSSPTFGRIPNLVTTASIAYNTADGTPRFIIALVDYAARSGDTPFLRTMWPVIVRSVDGTLKYHTDSLGFLTHGDAETWMDAVGPDGAWSPRGNRANDIQALWHGQLAAAIEAAGILHETGPAAQWAAVDSALRKNFERFFIDRSTGLIADRLLPDGHPDLRLRPNEIFTAPLLNPAGEEAMVRRITHLLVYPHGIASLSQEDDGFHPYHMAAPYYVKDAAYHNGTVWTWLAGQWIDLAAKWGATDLAWTVTSNMTHQILDRGAVGTLSELLDAVPHPHEKEARLSGAFSQAWSLAEYIRSFYESYAGVRTSRIGSGEILTLMLNPHLPPAIKEMRLRVPGTEVRLVERREKGGTAVEVMAGEPVNLSGSGGGGRLGRGEHAAFTIPAARPGEPMHLAAPVMRENLRAMQGPGYPLIPLGDIKRPAGSARILCDADDPAGDDTLRYKYPTSSMLKPSSLDLTHFTVAGDDRAAYFTLTFSALSDPGWHPEYGFQLTFAAIAIDEDGVPGSGGRDVGANSGYTLDPAHAFERIIYVGGGVRVADASCKVLAEYLPQAGDEKNPLGSIARRTISFSLPAELVGKPSPSWRYTVLVGAQDDHGGAGIGEFRAIGKEAGEWVGGGKMNPKDPNIYDILQTPQ